MKSFFRFCISILNYKRVSEKQLEPLLIDIDKDNIVCFNLSSNPIIAVQLDEGMFYFRECPEIGKKIQYITKRIERFFCYIHNTSLEKINFKQNSPIRLSFTEYEVEAFKSYIYERLGNKKFIKALLRIDKSLNKLNFSIWGKKNTLNAEEMEMLGFGGLAKELQDIAIYFIWYMRAVVVMLRNKKIVRGKQYSFYNATKSISTYIMADALGLKELITNPQWCQLNIGGDCFFGLISREAPGGRASDISNIQVTSSLQKDLINLNVLDTICFQPDHGPNNYNIIFDQARAISVCAFDNDNPNTFFPISNIKKGLSGCVPFVNSTGMIHRGHFDFELAHCLLNLNIKETNKKLKPYLNVLQRVALFSRIRKLNKAIHKTSHYRKDFLIDFMAWDEEILREEISGKYGKTYLVSLLNGSLQNMEQ